MPNVYSSEDVNILQIKELLNVFLYKSLDLDKILMSTLCYLQGFKDLKSPVPNPTRPDDFSHRTPATQDKTPPAKVFDKGYAQDEGRSNIEGYFNKPKRGHDSPLRDTLKGKARLNGCIHIAEYYMCWLK